MELILGLLIGAALVIAAVTARARLLDFGAQTPGDYTVDQPTFDIKQHLNGAIACEGVIFGPTGRVSSRFVAEFHAEWEGNTGRMTEHFRYDSGTTQNREWHLTLDENGKIIANAADLVGAGTGQQAGSGVCLKYRIQLPESAGSHQLDVVDWMYLVENGTIINRSQFRKFGIKVGELVATMRPLDPAEAIRRDAA